MSLIQPPRRAFRTVMDFPPARDVNDITCITAGYLILNAIGAALRAGAFDRKN